MVMTFRHGDPRFPFLWGSAAQPAARWHGPAEGPVQYLADTPDGAWAEFLRHEAITDPLDLPGVRRRLWVVEFDRTAETERHARLAPAICTGDLTSYPACQQEARKARADGVSCLRAPSAALRPGAARGQVTDGTLREAAERDGVVWILFGQRPLARGWAAVDVGAPSERVLGLVAHLPAVSPAPLALTDFVVVLVVPATIADR